MKATQKDAYELFHRGTLAFARVEANGIKIDRDYLRKATRLVSKQITEIEDKLKSGKVWKLWQNRFGDKANLTSPQQLTDILFEDMGFPVTMRTRGGKPSTDEEHLKTVDIPFVERYLEHRKLEKVKSTYLGGIERELDNHDLLHPNFNLTSGGTGSKDDDKGGASSYRGSSDSPNFNNFPIRSKRFGKLIRTSVIPRQQDWQLLEVDYGGIEVYTALFYHHDPTMLTYIQDPTKDMHRDMAMECYMLDFADWEDEQYKDLRYCAKNKFVFPQFYGSVYYQCAPNLWKAITQMNLVLPDGTSVKEHLKRQGIKSLGLCDPDVKPKPGTFEHHIWKVQQDFWERRFSVYNQWKIKWYNAYRKRGYFDLLTGFRVEGYMRRNKVINIPVQGVAFHCLLWSLIQIQDYILKHKMWTKIIGEIHDSIIFDGPPEEIQELIPVIYKIMTQDIRKHWSWITVPLKVEFELSPPGASWFEKEKIKKKQLSKLLAA